MTTTWKISAPVETFTGEVAGCAFANGRYEGPAGIGAVNYFRGAGYSVERVDDEPTDPDTEAEAEAEQPAVRAPAKSATKADWVAFVVEHHDVDQAAAEKLSRDQLAAQYGPKGEEQ